MSRSNSVSSCWPKDPDWYVYSDSDSDIEYTPSNSDKRMSSQYEMATSTANATNTTGTTGTTGTTDKPLRSMDQIKDAIAHYSAHLRSLHHLDPASKHVVRILQALHVEFANALIERDNDQSSARNHAHHDQLLPGPSPDKVTPATRKKWNTVKKVSGEPQHPHRKEGGFTVDTPSRSTDELFKHPFKSLTKEEKARAMLPLLNRNDPKVCDAEEKAERQNKTGKDNAAATQYGGREYTAYETQRLPQFPQQYEKGNKWSTVNVKPVVENSNAAAVDISVLKLSDPSTQFSSLATDEGHNLRMSDRNFPGAQFSVAHVGPITTADWDRIEEYSRNLATFTQVETQMREQKQKQQAEQSRIYPKSVAMTPEEVTSLHEALEKLQDLNIQQSSGREAHVSDIWASEGAPILKLKALMSAKFVAARLYDAPIGKGIESSELPHAVGEKMYADYVANIQEKEDADTDKEQETVHLEPAHDSGSEEIPSCRHTSRVNSLNGIGAPNVEEKGAAAAKITYKATSSTTADKDSQSRKGLDNVSKAAEDISVKAGSSSEDAIASLRKAFDTLGFERYSTVDWSELVPELQSSLWDLLSQPWIREDSRLILEIVDAFDVIVKYQEEHDCWNGLLVLQEPNPTEHDIPTKMHQDSGADIPADRAASPEHGVWSPRTENIDLQNFGDCEDAASTKDDPKISSAPLSGWDEVLPSDAGESFTSKVTVDTKNVPEPKAPTSTTYTVTYWATIEADDDIVHIPIDSNNVSGAEKSIIESNASMKKVWKWVQEKGLGDKIGLQDAFDLAKDMRSEDEGDKLFTKKYDDKPDIELDRPTSKLQRNDSRGSSSPSIVRWGTPVWGFDGLRNTAGSRKSDSVLTSPAPWGQ